MKDLRYLSSSTVVCATLRMLFLLGAVLMLTVVASAGTERVLYRFTGGSGDGAIPNGKLVADAAGNLYVTTVMGGKQ